MDMFSTNVLMGVVASLIQAPRFLLSRFFGLVQTEQTEEIHFDVISKTRRLAPFVSPLVEGKVVASQGYIAKTFKPAYIKDKRVWDGNRALKRSPGEQIGGSLTPMERMQALLRFDLQDQVDMITRRLEVMAAEVLRTGKVTVEGDLYPKVEVDFGRAAGNTIALAGAAKWDAATSTPLDDLQTWALLVLKATGVLPTEVVMDPDAWSLFKSHAQVKDRLTLQRVANAMPSMAQGAPVAEGGTYMGTIDNFNIYAYAGWYIDAVGVEQPILPSKTVILGSPAIEGVQAFGAIRDEEAGFQAVPYYPKSWVEKDPAVRYLLMQSAPLVVPTRPNASVCVTVA